MSTQLTINFTAMQHIKHCADTIADASQPVMLGTEYLIGNGVDSALVQLEYELKEVVTAIAQSAESVATAAAAIYEIFTETDGLLGAEYAR